MAEKLENSKQSAKDGGEQKHGPAKKEPGEKDKKDEKRLFKVMVAEKKSALGSIFINPLGRFEKVESGRVVSRESNPSEHDKAQHDFNNLNAGQVAMGDGHVTIGTLTIEAPRGGEGRQGGEKTTVKKSYLEVVTELHLVRELELPEFELDALTCHLAELRRSRLLVVNCYDEDLADASVSALVESLSTGGGCEKLYLDCDSNELDDNELRVELFTAPNKDAQTPSVVLVDASGKRGTVFLESLLVKRQTASNLSGYLESNRLWLICRGNAAHLCKRVREDRSPFFFPCWELDRLPELLKHHFPDCHQTLLARIERLRAAGFWAEEEVFWAEVRGLVAGGRLEEEVSKYEQAEAPARAVTDGRESFIRSFFRGGDSIKDTVLYVAVYFPDLNPHEFNRVVSALLEGLTTKVAVPAPKAADAPPAEPNGKSPSPPAPAAEQPAFIWEEQPLARAWHDGADEILAECRLEASTGKDAARRLDFADPALRQDLRAYLEAEKGFYLKKQFDRIRRLGLLFDRSLNVNEGVISVAVNMALENPESFGRDWLFDIVSALSPLLESVRREVVSPDGTAYRPALPPDLEAAMRVVYSTVARLVRKMLEHSHLEKTLNDFFTQLMASGQHEAVLEIVRRLQTTQQFELRWFRQLFDQGGEVVQLKTYLALYERVRRRDAGIYEVLQALESWLPERERVPLFYSPSNEYALRLMFEYCLDSTAEFDSKSYGSWPCRYPLLATPGLNSPEGGRATRDNLTLLAGWLFHPGMREVLTEEEEDDDPAASLNVSLGALLAEWAVILLGGDVAAGGANGNGRRAAARPEAEAVFDLLLRKIISVTTPAQQQELIACWADLADYFLWHINAPGAQNGEPRRRLSRRRNWVRHLIKRFKILRRQAD